MTTKECDACFTLMAESGALRLAAQAARSFLSPIATRACPSASSLASSPTPVAAPRLIQFNHSLADELGLQDRGSGPERSGGDFRRQRDPARRRADRSWPMRDTSSPTSFLSSAMGARSCIGEVLDRDGVRRDIQLKGSGLTPFSRRGDGRAALGPVLREYLVSEAMHALGVPTTRALAAVSTGQPVYREGRLPGAILTRVAASHLRVGNLPVFRRARRRRRDSNALPTTRSIATTQRRERMSALIWRCFAGSSDRQARLIARWM